MLRVFNGPTRIYLQFETVIKFSYNVPLLTYPDALKFGTVLVSGVGTFSSVEVSFNNIGFRRARGERWEERKGEEQSDPLGETRRWVVSCSNAGRKGGWGGGKQEVLC